MNEETVRQVNGAVPYRLISERRYTIPNLLWAYSSPACVSQVTLGTLFVSLATRKR